MDSVSGAGYFDFPPIHFFLQFRVVVTTCLDAGMILSSGLSNQDCSEQYNVYHKNMIQSLPFFHRKMPSMSHFWTHLLIDEAGQASEPETAVPLSVIATSVSYHDQELCLPRLILSGDHMQVC
jgi:helicase MOV-10